MSSEQIKKVFNAGVVLQKQGKLQEAMQHYRSCIKADIQFRPAYVNLGALYSKVGKGDQAIQFFEKALKLAPDTAILFNLGSELYRKGDYQKSRDYLIQSLKLDARLLRSHLLLAYIYGKEKKLDKAEIYFKNALKIESNNKIALLGLSTTLAESKKLDEALQFIEGYLRLFPNDQTMRNLRAGIWIEQGKVEESMKELQTLTKTQSGYTSFTDHLQKAKQSADDENKVLFEEVQTKIGDRTEKLRRKIAERKAKRAQGQPAQIDKKDDMKDLLDLSFLHLFEGDSQKALQYLQQAAKMGKKSPVTPNK